MGLNDTPASIQVLAVTAVMTEPYVTLNANIESGIAPLETYFTVSTSIPNSVATYDFDYEGDSIIDYTGATFEDISVIYSTEGVYYPTITVTDSQSNTYTDTIALVVLNEAELDALLQAKWEGMKTALTNQDINTALLYFGDFSKDKYERVFIDLGNDLPSIISTLPDIVLISLSSNGAEYAINRMQGGVNRLYFIYFIKDENGLWKIDSF